MKKGTKIRFRHVRYTSDLEVIERTNTVMEGTVLYENEAALTVKVAGRKCPCYVEKKDLVE